MAARMAAATAAASWAQRVSPTSSPPTAARRSRVIRTVLSSTLAATLGSSVWISRARQGRNGATRSSGPSPSAARQRSSSAAEIANGMILTVATIWPGSTTACSGRVASVTASSIRLNRSTRSRSTTSSPRAVACRLARPVKAGATSTAAARDQRCQLRRSPVLGRRRRRRCARRPRYRPRHRAAAADRCAESRWPLRSTTSPALTLCASTAPSASSRAKRSNSIGDPAPRYVLPYIAMRRKSARARQPREESLRGRRSGRGMAGLAQLALTGKCGGHRPRSAAADRAVAAGEPGPGAGDLVAAAVHRAGAVPVAAGGLDRQRAGRAVAARPAAVRGGAAVLGDRTAGQGAGAGLGLVPPAGRAGARPGSTGWRCSASCR